MGARGYLIFDESLFLVSMYLGSGWEGLPLTAFTKVLIVHETFLSVCIYNWGVCVCVRSSLYAYRTPEKK